MVGRLCPSRRRVGRPATQTSAEFLAAFEKIAAEHGIAPVDLIAIIREAAGMRIADAITLLCLTDRIEDLKRGLPP